jgi:phenylpropionate dioxygenase-like ring-hydroxylating dioxygenase large terminal subunit
VITSRLHERYQGATVLANGFAHELIYLTISWWTAGRSATSRCQAHVMIEVGVALAGKGGYDAQPEFKASTLVVDFITPETDTSIHYFWAMARNFKPRDASLTTQIPQRPGSDIAEDKDMLERQQANLLRWPDRRLLKLNIDAGGVHARRVIDRQIAAEKAVLAPLANTRTATESVA